MKTTTFISSLCAAIVALHGSAFAGGEGWTSDFAAAKKEATESKKDLLIDFTGSDWCGWCIKLNDEVFKFDAFKDGVKDKFVLVELDYPKDTSKLSKETIAQNKELLEKYAVGGYPTILLTDAEGRPYAMTGYQEGGPEKYVESLDELRAVKTTRDEAFAAASSAEGVAKAKALIAALDALKLPEKMLECYTGIAEQIVAADPKDETGYMAKKASAERFAEFKKAFSALAAKKDMDGAMALLEKALAEGGFPTEDTQQMMVTRAMILAQQQKLPEAVKAMDESIEFAPDSPMAPRLKAIRDNMQKAVEKAAEPAAEPADEKPKEEE